MNLLKQSYKKIDKFFAVSKAMYPLLTNMGVSKNKLVTIHNPMNTHKKIKNDLKQHWTILVKYNESKNSIKLKEEIDRCSKNIPLMFTVGIADGQTFSQMFKTMNISMYDYLSKDKKIHPIFLDYLR